MHEMTDIFVILVSAILVDNFVLSKFLGICPFLGVSKKVSSSLGMGLAVIFVMFMATLGTYPVYMYLLVPYGLEYLNVMAFILIIALFVQLVEMALRKLMPPLYKALGVYLPLITTNCAVLGVTLLNVGGDYTLLEALVNAIGAGAGFLLALLLFSGVRVKLERSDVPAMFKGVPATLIAASIISLAFVGFGGLV